MAMILLLERSSRRKIYCTVELARTLSVEASSFQYTYVHASRIQDVTVDDISVAFTTQEYATYEPVSIGGGQSSVYQHLTFTEIAIPDYVEDGLQHKVVIEYYIKDSISSQDLTQYYTYYTLPRNRSLLEMIGDHLFRDEVFEKPFDLHLGLLITTNPPVEVSQYCLYNTNHTRIDDDNEIVSYTVNEDTFTRYERLRVLPSQFKMLVPETDGVVSSPGNGIITNYGDLSFFTLRESVSISGIGLYLTPFLTSPLSPPILTIELETPVSYVAKSPVEFDKNKYNWKGEGCEEIIIRDKALRVSFASETSSMTYYMQRLIGRHVFLDISETSLLNTLRINPDDLVNKPTGFYIGLLKSLTKTSDNHYYTQPDNVDYSRVFYPSGDASWNVVDLVYSNANEIIFNQPSTDWGAIIGIGLFNVEEYNLSLWSGLCFYTIFENSINFTAGSDAYVIAPGQLTISLA